MLAPLPPLDAYRRDLARLGARRTFGPHDARWVTAATLLERYLESAAADRARLATELARHLAVAEGTSFWRVCLNLAEEIEEAGALQLAHSVLALQERLASADRALDLGRILAYRARVARKLGATEVSRALYAEVARMGETSAEPELTARAWIGFAVIAVERGNIPEARRWFEAAALVADDTECPEQSSLAHQGLMTIFGAANDFEAALVQGGHAFRWARGDSNREAEMLANLGKLLYDMGHHAAAVRGLAAVVNRTRRPRILLGALGTLATVAAVLERRGVVASVAQRVERIADAAWPHPAALALLDLSDAYALINEPARADGYRQRALAIAQKESFHELVFRAESNPPGPVTPTWPIELGSAAIEVLGNVESLDAPLDLCAVA